jgi:hypothetical protein
MRSRSTQPTRNVERGEDLQQRSAFGILPAIITILALADGALHFSLDFILFRGPPRNAGTQPRPPAPPPGGGPLVRMPLPLNELFLINAAGYLLLVLLFWFGPRLLGIQRRVVGLLMALWACGTILGWLDVGRPNPMGLGYIAKAIEVVLIAVVILYASTRAEARQQVAAAA